MRLKPGKDYPAQHHEKTIHGTIDIEVYANEILVVSYPLAATSRAVEGASPEARMGLEVSWRKLMDQSRTLYGLK